MRFIIVVIATILCMTFMAQAKPDKIPYIPDKLLGKLAPPLLFLGGAYGTAAAGAVVGYALASGHNPMHGMHMGVNGEQSAQYVPVVLHRV